MCLIFFLLYIIIISLYLSVDFFIRNLNIFKTIREKNDTYASMVFTVQSL